MDPPAFPTDQIRGLKAHGIAEKGRGEDMPIRTGKQFLDALHDDRQIFIDGERIATSTADPRFAGAAQSVAELYDMQHDPALHRADDLRLAVERRARSGCRLSSRARSTT